MNKKLIDLIKVILLFVIIVLVLAKLGAFKWLNSVIEWDEDITMSDLLDRVK